MKIMFVTKDIELYQDLKKFRKKISLPVELFSGTNEPLDIMSTVCAQNPALVVLDDDDFLFFGAMQHLLDEAARSNSQFVYGDHVRQYYTHKFPTSQTYCPGKPNLEEALALENPILCEESLPKPNRTLR